MIRDGIKEGDSLNVYDCSIKKMYVEVFKIHEYNTDDILHFFQNTDDVLQWIDTSFKIHNKSARASHIIKYLEACNTQNSLINSNASNIFGNWYNVAIKKFKEYKNKCQAEASQKMPEEKKQPEITYNEMDKILDTLNKDCCKENASVESNIKRRIMVLFCSPEFPTMRGQEICEMEIEDNKETIEANKDKNYCSLEHKKFFIRNHKTNKAYGDKGVDIPENILNVLQDTATVIKSKWLIPKLSDVSKNQDRHNLKYAFKSILGKSVSIQILRRLFHSYAQDTGRTKEDFEKHCRIMGHSCGTAYKNYLAAYSKTLFTPATKEEPPKAKEEEPTLTIEPKQNVAEQIFPTASVANDLELEIIKLRKIISLQSNTIKEQQDVIKLLTHNE